VTKKTFVSAVMFVFIAALSSFSQQKIADRESRTDLERYFRVLDRIFADKDKDFPDVVVAVKLRFMPGFTSESEIILIRTPQKVKVIRLKSRVDLYYMIIRAVGSQEDQIAATILKKHPLEKRISEMPVAEFDEWFSELMDAMRQTIRKLQREMEVEINENWSETVLDGGYYQLSKIQRLNTTMHRLYDETPDPTKITGRYELTQVMNKIRLRIESGTKDPRHRN
jgi:hypothetical protein